MFSFKSKLEHDVTAGITITPQGIALAIVTHKAAKPHLKYAQFYNCSPEEQLALLIQLVSEHHLDEIPCNLVLSANEYQLLQVAMPDVAENELNSALRWQIKDLIDFDIDDAIIEHLSLPNNALGKEPKLVVACRQSLIQGYVDLLLSAHCNLESIDIASLATRNIISQTSLGEIQTSIGVLNVWNDMAKISVLLNNDLYMDRTSSLSLHSLLEATDGDSSDHTPLDSLALELQRTFDYYESHSRQPSIMHLCILTNGAAISNLEKLIQQRLGLDCLMINITDFMTASATTLARVTNNCMMAIGGALRNEH